MPSEISRFQASVADFLEPAALCALQLICTCLPSRRAACVLPRHSLDADSAPQALSVTASRWAHSRWFLFSPAHPSLCASAAASGDELLRASVLSPHPLSLSATPLCCCGTWSRPSAARHPLQLFLSVSCSSSFWYASTRPGLCLSSSPASASSRTPTLVLFGSVHQWILHSSDRTLLDSYDAKALIASNEFADAV